MLWFTSSPLRYFGQNLGSGFCMRNLTLNRFSERESTSCCEDSSNRGTPTLFCCATWSDGPPQKFGSRIKVVGGRIFYPYPRAPLPIAVMTALKRARRPLPRQENLLLPEGRNAYKNLRLVSKYRPMPRFFLWHCSCPYGFPSVLRNSFSKVRSQKKDEP